MIGSVRKDEMKIMFKVFQSKCNWSWNPRIRYDSGIIGSNDYGEIFDLLHVTKTPAQVSSIDRHST